MYYMSSVRVVKGGLKGEPEKVRVIVQCSRTALTGGWTSDRTDNVEPKCEAVNGQTSSTVLTVGFYFNTYVSVIISLRAHLVVGIQGKKLEIESVVGPDL